LKLIRDEELNIERGEEKILRPLRKTLEEVSLKKNGNQLCQFSKEKILKGIEDPTPVAVVKGTPFQKLIYEELKETYDTLEIACCAQCGSRKTKKVQITMMDDS